MSRFGILGIVGAVLLAAGCVSSSQHNDLMQKYLEAGGQIDKIGEVIAEGLAASGIVSKKGDDAPDPIQPGNPATSPV